MRRKTFICVFMVMAIEGIDLGTLSVALSVIREEFSLTAAQAGAIFSVSTAGMLAGGVICGWLADRFGRLRAMQTAILTFIVFICLSVLTRDFILFCVIRFFSSAGMSGVWSSGTVMVSEYTPTSRRNTVLGMLQGASALGFFTATILNGIITPDFGWRPVVLIAVACGIVALGFTRTLREPPAFELQQKKEAKRKKGNSLSLLLADRRSKVNLAKWLCCSFFLMAGYYGANSWLPTYMTSEFGVEFRSMTYYIAGNYAMVFLGKMLAGILSDKMGRKKIWFLACLCTAVILPVVIKVANAGNVGIILLLFGLFYGAPMALCSTFMSESFPTECRALGTALSYNLGRVGAMLSPVIIGAIADHSASYSTGFMMIAAFYFACGCTVLLIKEKQFDPNKL